MEGLIDPRRSYVGEAVGWAVGFQQKIDIVAALMKVVDIEGDMKACLSASLTRVGSKTSATT